MSDLITLPVGESLELEAVVTLSGAAAVDACTFHWTLKQGAGDADEVALIRKDSGAGIAVQDVVTGALRISALSRDESAALPAGRKLYWDLKRVDTADPTQAHIVASGTITTTRPITRRTAAL